jgi:hypothetical protein
MIGIRAYPLDTAPYVTTAHKTRGLSLYVRGVITEFGPWPYWGATEPGAGRMEGGQRIARGHMAPHVTWNKGVRTNGGG